MDNKPKIEMVPAPPLQDPLTMAAKHLGEAKTEATTLGMEVIDTFNKIQKEMAVLKQHGITISVEFENKAIQAAWQTYTTGAWSTEMPIMETEGALVRRIRG